MNRADRRPTELDFAWRWRDHTLSMRCSLVRCALAALAAILVPHAAGAAPPVTIEESVRAIPVLADVDVVVVGGASHGVAAAARMGADGGDVYLVAQESYLGEDICATRRLWLATNEAPATALGQTLFPSPGSPVKPMQVKLALDRHLEDNGVPYLTGTYATELLRDVAGNLAGVVVANRAGRQAILARTIVDATDRAWVARMAGAQRMPFPTGATQSFTRVVIGGAAQSGPRIASAETQSFQIAGYPVHVYDLRLPVSNGHFASYAVVEQDARDMTFDKGLRDASDRLFTVPPDPIVCRARIGGPWPGADVVDPDVFRPQGIERLYVLGGCADVSREAAAVLLRPHVAMALAERLAATILAEARRVPRPRGVHVDGANANADLGEVRELLKGARPVDEGGLLIPSPARGLPVLGRWDVVVVGGGTGGAPAGIGAGRYGAKTLLLEYQHKLGGVGTIGMIGKYYHGNRVGFTAEVDAGMNAMACDLKVVVGKAEWWRIENRAADTDVWFGAIGCGALVSNETVTGVVVATPEGRGVVLAGAVVDATGNSDIAAAAGAECDFTGNTTEHIGMQGTGLPPNPLDRDYLNTDYTFVDETDAVDTWHVLAWAREKYSSHYDLSGFVDTRERQRIVGDLIVMPMDIYNQRTYPDTIVRARSNFDSHGFTVHTLFMLHPPDKTAYTVAVPYRSLLPADLDGILVTGLGVSAHRDAMPVIRMQPDIQNQGYAAGWAAAMAVSSNTVPRGIGVRALQQHLVDVDILPANVLDDNDSYPFSTAELEAAVASVAVTNTHANLSAILAHWADAAPLVRDAYAATNGAAVLRYAQLLGAMGDSTGSSNLIAAIESYAEWDAGWNFVGMGQFGPSLSALDRYIVALGCSGDTNGLPCIMDKVALLEAGNTFSHFRAVSLALGRLRLPASAPALRALLELPGMTGHAVTSLDEARARYGSSNTENTSRNNSLKEIVLARALYQCGDDGGVGRRILRRYSRDLRGIFARHALAVLNRGPGYGDVDGNGRINTVDALHVWRMAAGDEPMPDPGSDAAREADINGNGTIDSTDANLILVKAVGEVGR